MKISRLLAVARKEFLHLLRDWRSLGMGIFIPLFMLFMFSYALSLDVDHIPMVIWDQSQTPQSRDLISRFEGSRYFSIAGSFDRYSAMEKAIDSRTALLALVIPGDFARKIGKGVPADVQVIVDGSNTATAQIATGYAAAVVNAASARIIAIHLKKRNGGIAAGQLDLRPTVWFNPELESKNFIIPGLIATIMMVIAGLLTSLTIAREWENGTMEQLIASPLRGHEIIFGKLIPYFTLGMFDMVLCAIVGIEIFHVPFRGNFFLLFFLAAIFLTGALGIGIYISIATKKQLVANELGVLATFLPSFLLSGFIYPISNMPKFLQAITLFVPARHFIVILRGIYLKGVGLAAVSAQAAYLAGFAVFMLVLSNLAFKKRMT